MIEPWVILVVSDILRQLVPMLYLGMALYLGFVGTPRRLLNWLYIALFGGFGVGAYMLLNKPTYDWIPLWVTNETWFVISLLSLLAIGLLLFFTAIETQGIAGPVTCLKDIYRWTRRLFSR